jgi:hypothetical protein
MKSIFLDAKTIIIVRSVAALVDPGSYLSLSSSEAFLSWWVFRTSIDLLKNTYVEDGVLMLCLMICWSSWKFVLLALRQGHAHGH